MLPPVLDAQTVDQPATQDCFHTLSGSFGGVPAAQIWADFVLWELVLNDNPQLRAIAEIGTWQGGFSRYLHAQAAARGMGFRTWDAVVPPDPPPGFQRLDVFAEPEVVTDFCRSFSSTVLLCDGGNKPRELKLFSSALGGEHLFVVHDWLTEIGPEDVPDGLDMVYTDVCETLESMTRIFRRIQ